MNVPWLTRENVASHLQVWFMYLHDTDLAKMMSFFFRILKTWLFMQKYRLYLSRLQKENDPKACFVVGMKHTDSCSKDRDGNFSLCSSLAGPQTDVTNSSFSFSGDNFLLQNDSSEPKTAAAAAARSVPEPIKLAAFDPSKRTCYPWVDAPETKFKQEIKPVVHSEGDFSQFPATVPPHHVQIDQLQSISSISSGRSATEKDIASSIESKPMYSEECSQQMVHVNLPKVATDPSSTTTTTTAATTPLGKKNQSLNLSSISTDIGSGLPFESFDEDLQGYLLEDGCYPKNLDHQQIIEFPDYGDPGLFTEVPAYLYDAMRFGYEYSYDPTEYYPVIDEGLFIA